MNVLVVYEVVGRDIRFVMVAKVETLNMVSRIHTLKDVTVFHNRPDKDPYILYGDACSVFTGGFGYKITAAHIEQGSLEEWVQ